ncbi:MAG: hypothetical protein AMXMBFR64_49040 [Myxococcales bacterium]
MGEGRATQDLDLEALRVRVAALEQENRRLRTTRTLLDDLVEQAPFSIQVLDANARVVAINAAHERLIGLPRSRYFALMTEDFRTYIRRSMPAGADALERAFAGESVELPPFFYQAVVGPHGTSAPLSERLARGIYLAARAFPVRGDDGKVAYVVLINEDVTARVRLEHERAASEQRYRTLVESLNDAVVVFDEDRVITLWNLAAERTYGWSAGDVVGRPAQEVLKTETAEGTPEDVMERIARVGSWHGTLWQQTRDGRRIEVECAASYVPHMGMSPDERGVVVCVNRDVTEHRRLQAQVVHAQRMESIGTLAGGIAHEFNNMLAGILGYASLLSRRVVEPELGGPLQIIQESASRGARLTQQLLTFARKQEVSRVILSVNGAVESAMGFLSQIIGKAVSVDLALDPLLHAVRGDPWQMEQVLVNLCLNARDSMAGGGIIRIETTRERLPMVGGPAELAPGDYVRLRVRDSGAGMAREVLDRIFEPFFTTKETGTGTGLGLAVVYGIVKDHGGAVLVSSAPGDGTTFDVYLPAVAEPLVAADPVPPAEPPSGDATVLVVDDEPVVREMAAAMLKSLGYRTLVAHDGAEAVDVVRERGDDIGLVLMDLIMPGMDGLETFRAIEAVRPGVPVLLSSGLHGDHLVQQVLTEGALGFVGKPYDVSQLAAAVRAALDRSACAS